MDTILVELYISKHKSTLIYLQRLFSSVYQTRKIKREVSTPINSKRRSDQTIQTINMFITILIIIFLSILLFLIGFDL